MTTKFLSPPKLKNSHISCLPVLLNRHLKFIQNSLYFIYPPDLPLSHLLMESLFCSSTFSDQKLQMYSLIFLFLSHFILSQSVISLSSKFIWDPPTSLHFHNSDPVTRHHYLSTDHSSMFLPSFYLYHLAPCLRRVHCLYRSLSNL